MMMGMPASITYALLPTVAPLGVRRLAEEPGSKEARLLFSARLAAPDVMLVECANILWKKAHMREISKRQAMER